MLHIVRFLFGFFFQSKKHFDSINLKWIKRNEKKEIFFWFLQTFLLLGLHSSVNVKNIVYSSDNLCFLTFHGETKYNTINSHALEHWVEKAKYGYWKNSVVYLISLPTIKAYQVKKKIKKINKEEALIGNRYFSLQWKNGVRILRIVKRLC